VQPNLLNIDSHRVNTTAKEIVQPAALGITQFSRQSTIQQTMQFIWM
jgi:hypothetical protein